MTVEDHKNLLHLRDVENIKEMYNEKGQELFKEIQFFKFNFKNEYNFGIYIK
jgi:hypothetical protein